MPPIDQAAVAAKLAWNFGAAGVAAFGAIATHVLGSDMPQGMEGLAQLGFAGFFILALLGALKVVWDARIRDVQLLSDKLDSMAAQKAALEKEVRESLRQDLRDATASRQEMIRLMKGGSPGGD